MGTFNESEDVKVICNGNSITHENANDKNHITAEWVAPANFSGKFYFRYTVVKSYPEYWVGLESKLLEGKATAENSGKSEKSPMHVILWLSTSLWLWLAVTF